MHENLQLMGNKTRTAVGYLRRLFLISTSLVCLSTGTALAQTVVTNGQTLNNTNLTLNNGGSLTVQSGGSVTDSAASGVTITAGASAGVNNSGVITGSGAFDAILLGAGAVLDITNSGLVQGGVMGIDLPGAGTINLNNLADGIVQGGAFGVGGSNVDAHANITNAGQILGGTGIGVVVYNIDSLSNLSGGLITGAMHGVNATNIGNLINSGKITGTTSMGISTANLNSLINLAGGEIWGGDIGIVSTNNIVSLINAEGALIHGNTNYGISAGGITDLFNAGIIEGGNGRAIYAGSLTNLTNAESGLINGIVYIGANTNNIINQGQILSDAPPIANSSTLYVDGNLFNLNNSGLIQNQGSYGANIIYGVRIFDTLRNVDNSGSIRSINTAVDGNSIALHAGIIGELVNSGLIEASAGVSAVAVFADTITKLTNSGRIIADLDANDFAILEDVSGDTDLFLLPGSVIQGRIDIQGDPTDSDNLYVGNGLNLATTFDDLPDTIQAYGALQATNGTLVAVADTSALAAQDNAMSETTGAISGVLSEQLDMKHAQHEQNYWLKGFGGLSRTNGSGPAVAVNHLFGGAMVGADTMLGDIQFGLFGGFSAGVLDVAVKNGQDINTTNYFAGAYGRFDADAFYVDDLRPISPPTYWRIRRFVYDLMRPVFAMPFSWRIRWA